MAYVLVAVGALMAAAGLCVTGYSALNTRFEEYWASMTAGATLLAGGIVTVAIGFATRALRDLRRALSSQPSAVSPGAVAAGEAAATPPPTGADHPPEQPREARTPPARPQVLRPLLPRKTAAPPPIETHAIEQLEPASEAIVAASSVAPAYDPPAVRPEAVPPNLVEPEIESHDFMAPADPSLFERAQAQENQATEPPSLTGHDEKPELPRPAALPSPSSEPHRTPDDWLDRAFADLDQELAIGAPLSPRVATDRQDALSRSRIPPRQATENSDPASAAESTVAAPRIDEPIPAAPMTPEPPAPAVVIGRYEAEGTAYVMYADGSIEAQSSAGVYRFKSMAELRSFIEN